jgi:SynChlorMet cassette protein ScmC
MSIFNANRYEMRLADGTHWLISAEDAQAAFFVSQLAQAMQLHPLNRLDPSISTDFKGKVDYGRYLDELYRLLVSCDGKHAQPFLPGKYPLLPSQNHGSIVCPLNHRNSEIELFIHLVRLSLILVRQAQTCGGILLHGALADYNGLGVVLAGPGGIGKSTASNRLPAPWRSLSDDLTLVVQDSQNNYWAHPWPTWSRFLAGGPGGEWNVQEAVPLETIFFLTQSTEDRAVPLGKGQAVSLLLSSTRQASSLMTKGLNLEEGRTIHIEWFNNICALSQSVPSQTLNFGLAGQFWREIERVLERPAVMDNETLSA